MSINKFGKNRSVDHRYYNVPYKYILVGSEFKGGSKTTSGGQVTRPDTYEEWVEKMQGSVFSELVDLSRETYNYIRRNNPECGISEWHGKPISLQIHHINGDHHDNRIENLQLLCPNCHSQTDTYSGRNANRENNTTYSKALSRKSISKEKWAEILEKKWKNNHPSKETLCNIFKEVGSFTGVAKLYNVSDKAITKWFAHYGLPIRKKELKKYLNM